MKARHAQWLGLTFVVFAMLVPFDSLVDNMVAASHAILGRDQGIFQYVAWAVRNGARDYGDVRDVNGPLTHVVHIVFQWLGGEREVVFRRLDLSVSMVSFFIGGAALPAIVAKDESRPGWTARMVWGTAGMVMLGAQYLRYLYWDLAQRESFCDWFVLVSIFLCAEAMAPWSRGKMRDALAFAAGLFAGLPVFGKHTYALFAMSLLITVAVCAPSERATSRAAAEGDARVLIARAPWRLRRRLALVIAGLFAAALLALAYLLAFGDVAAFVKIYLVDAPRVYTFIWPRTARDVISVPWAGRWPMYSGVTTILFSIACLRRWVPLRALFAMSLAPLGLLGVVLQKKGFPYHFHPVSLGVTFAALVMACAILPGRALAAPLPGFRRWVPTLRALLLGLVAGGGAFLAREGLVTSWFSITPWLVTEGSSEDARASLAYEERFRMPDFFPDETHLAADALVKLTRENDRVQTYGMDPYVLYLARRKSATPYIYAYDLNVDAALGGAEELLTGAARARAREMILAFSEAHGADLLARLVAAPPAAFVLIDHSPLMTRDDALGDLEAHQPKVHEFLVTRYENAFETEHVHVYLLRAP